jgi:hypothetical protein
MTKIPSLYGIYINFRLYIMLNKIVSGRQTGADSAALDAGIESGFPVGGYCPVGRLAEDGEIDAEYPVTELGGYRQRTRKNAIKRST